MLLVTTAGRAFAQVSGAIYTTLSDGSSVNSNLYPDRESVYLNGGPNNTQGSGLPPGEYYYQVTDPAAKVLLSTDDVRNRRLVVNSSGRVAGSIPDPTDGATYPGHANGTQDPSNGSIGVQLFPYDFTPNAGGVYKVWLTPVDAYDPTPGAANFGFVESHCKTDNFKIKDDGGGQQGFASIVINKYHDLNGNGSRDDGEPALDGFHFVVTFTDKDGNPVAGDPADPVSGTDGAGTVIVTAVAPVSQFPIHYVVTEVGQDGWIQTEPASGYSGDVDSDGVNTLVFGNAQLLPLSGLKYYDVNGNGTQDNGETGIGGFTINVKVTSPGGTVSTETLVSAADGTWATANSYIEGSTYEVSEATPAAPWKQTEPANTGSYTGTLSTNTPSLVFGNAKYFNISGVKYYDANANGSRDNGEVGVSGFTFNVIVNGVTTQVTSAADGTWSAGPFLEGSTYSVTEVQKGAPWVQTQPANNGGYSGTLADNVTGLAFGNLKLGGGGGLTIGFWSNTNGQWSFQNQGPTSPYEANNLLFLRGLNLRNANGTNFDPTTYAQFKSWLLSATATNMSYMLSAQLSAMEMNVRIPVVKNKNGTVVGGVSGSALIYAPGTNSANSLGFATVDAVMAEANTELGLHGLVLDGSPYRTYQQALKNALDNANNNLNFVQPGP